MKIITQKETDLAALAVTIAKKLRPGAILALEGPLGAGKTTLTQQILKTLGYAGAVSSPTFVIEHRYPVNWRGIKTVLHLDLYRLSPQDLLQFDWDDYLKTDEQLTIIEWPAIAAKYLPPQTKTITIEVIDAKTRRLHLPNSLA